MIWSGEEHGVVSLDAVRLGSARSAIQDIPVIIRLLELKSVLDVRGPERFETERRSKDDDKENPTTC